MNKDHLSSYKTTWAELPDGGVTVTYIHTEIVRYDGYQGDTITLRSGGWETVTTKRKMNQAAQQFCLGYMVFQRDQKWFVMLPSGETVDFEDGMTFPRRKFGEAAT